jgi:hypothetical protein
MKRFLVPFFGLLLVSCYAQPSNPSTEFFSKTSTILPTRSPTMPEHSVTPASVSPTNTPPSPTPSLTPSPTPSLTPSPTPSPFPTFGTTIDISKDGPFLISLTNNNSVWSILYFTPKEFGSRAVDLPKDLGKSESGIDFELSNNGKWLLLRNGEFGYIFNAEKRIFTNLAGYQSGRIAGNQFSGDSKYLAYLSGSNVTDCILDTPVGCGESLMVLRLLDMKIVKEVNLLPKDYPSNLLQLTELWKTMGYPYKQPSEYSFFGGLGFRWSPNSQYLAFSGALSGPSTDIYLWNVNNQEIDQITNGPQNIFNLFWDPSGTYIINLSGTKTGCGGGFCEGDNLFYSSIYGGATTEITDQRECLYGETKKLLMQSLSNMLCEVGPELFRINFISQSSERVIPDGIGWAISDEESNTILIETDTTDYILYESLTNKKTKLDIKGQCDFNYFNSMMNLKYQAYRYMISCEDHVYFISPAGKILEMPYSPLMAGASSTGKWLILYVEYGKLLLFDADRKLVNSMDIKMYDDVGPKSKQENVLFKEPYLWSPNDNGVLIMGDREVFYITIPNLEVIEETSIDSFIPIGWIMKNK